MIKGFLHLRAVGARCGLAVGVTVLGLIVGDVPRAQARTDITPPLAYGRNADQIYAIRDPNIFTHNVGLLTLQITNVGIIGNPFINDFSAGWRGGEYLYFSGLWIGAIGSDSETHVSTAFPLELRPEIGFQWTVRESFEGVPGGARLGEADPEAADDDRDGRVDEDFPDGLDNDGDGLIDEDYAAIGQQMFACVYKDDTQEAIAQVSDHIPLNILVRQRSFEWSTPGINEFVGFEFEVVNNGEQRLKQLYLGFFSDSDCGPKTADRYWEDDLVGWGHIDTTIVDRNVTGTCGIIELQMDAAFMWDAPDNGTTIHGGDVDGVVGSLFLGHTTDDTGLRAPQRVGLTTVAWFSASGQNTDPQNDDERYQLLAKGTKPPRDATKPDDYRYLVAAGPFSQLNPGESLVFQTAYLVGDDRIGFRANAVNAQRIYNGRFINADRNELTGVDGKERCLFILEAGDEIKWDDPCDTLNTSVSIRKTPPCDGKSGVPIYVDADCSPCTGVGGAETLIHWVGTTAPPPPDGNTDPRSLENFYRQNPEFTADLIQSPAGDQRIRLQWNNSSELRKDPITGKAIFEGYRVWRVDNWQRPEGSIGPAPNEWMKIAEFRKDPSQAQGAKLLKEIQYDAEVKTTDNGPLFNIGRYAWEDSSGIINGKIYFYAVTAFGTVSVHNPILGEDELVDLSGQPTASEAQSIVPRWNSAKSTCDRVKVVPNPYRGRADWDLIPSERDPTGTKIAFRSLPEEPSRIRIYTLAGDLVQEVDHDGRDGNGTWFWNLITRNGQNVVSGVYLYSVDWSGGICRGRFVIIR